MPTMTMRLDETDAEVVRKYAEFEGKTISDFVRDAVFEKIEDQQDLATLREAIAADNGVRYTPHPRQRPQRQPIRRVALSYRQLPRPLHHRR